MDFFKLRLYDDLLSNYNKLVRPVVNTSDVLRVCIKLKLSQLIDVVSGSSLSFVYFVRALIPIFMLFMLFYVPFFVCFLGNALCFCASFCLFGCKWALVYYSLFYCLPFMLSLCNKNPVRFIFLWWTWGRTLCRINIFRFLSGF